MRLLIDRRDGVGSQDYTSFLDASANPRIARGLNRPATFQFGLVGGEGFVAPCVDARVTLERNDGRLVFSGLLVAAPVFQHVGWNEKGPVYRYEVEAHSDEVLLDRKTPSAHSPFIARRAGDALRQLSDDALTGWLDYVGVEDGDLLPCYAVNRAKTWSASAAEIAVAARCAYRCDAGMLLFAPLGTNRYELSEASARFSPGDLTLRNVNRVVNDLTVLGPMEPGAYVTDYFVGDGVTSKFYLSQIPFTRSLAGGTAGVNPRTLLYEEYASLDPTRWKVTDPAEGISVSGGKLQVAGGTGSDGQTHLDFIEKIELGGATVLQHGDVSFTAASDGVLGGLYAGTVSVAGCLAGFRITPSGTNCSIRALIGGVLTGAPLTTAPGHHYFFTTQLYPAETYRMQQAFHSSLHESGNARGGSAIRSGVRVVLEVHDIDPANPASQVAPATVLYDDVIADAPGFCTYALINSSSMHCSATFTYLFLATDALVRSTPKDEAPQTRRTGSLRDGAECHLSSEPALQFYPQYIPFEDEAIAVTYRGRGRARARVTDSASVAALRRGGDDGVRGAVREIAIPLPRTSEDCETAALALLDDSGQGWVGEYRAWSPFLPGGAADIFPGDALEIEVPSRSASFTAILHEVEIEFVDLAGENSGYTLKFVDAGDPALDFEFRAVTGTQASALTATEAAVIGDVYLPDLVEASITAITSTTVTIDAGFAPGVGEGIEVRTSDTGWGIDNDRNLAGRFTSRTFTLSRFSRVQDYFLRRYDSSSPPRYSRYSAGLHVDRPY